MRTAPALHGERLRSVCPSVCPGEHAAAGLQPPQRVTSAEDSHGAGTPCACGVLQGATKFSGAIERGRKIKVDVVPKEQIEKTTPG